MSATSPSPASATISPPPPTPSNSNSSAPQSPLSTTTPSPQAASPPLDTSMSLPPSPANAEPPAPPTSTPPTSSSHSPPPAARAAPPPEVPPPPPPARLSPPSSQPPRASPPPSVSPSVAPPPPPQAVPPTSPLPSNAPPPSSPPPPPPARSPSTPPSSDQPTPSPPPPSANPPNNSSPPPSSPRRNSPPPRNSSPPPAAVPPQSPSPPPASSPPRNSPPAPVATPPNSETLPSPPASQPNPSPSNSTPKSSPPRPTIRLAPPPSLLVSPPSLTPPTTSQSPAVPSDNGAGSSNPSGNGGIGTVGVVAIGVAAGILVLAFIGFAFWCVKRRKKRSPGNGGFVMPSTFASSPESDSSFLKTHSSAPLIQSGSGSDYVHTPSEPGGLGNSRSWFTYEELVKATNGFSSENMLGEGGFGSVYRGYLPDGREIAVKQLKIGGGQGEREFKAEVEIISRIHHRHLVSLVGYCIQDYRRLLVYDYVPNNTLHFHLHGEDRPVLDWPKRVRIAAGAARGLAYLHEDCNPRIIHRDIKSSNILLDYNFEARVSDFGLAKLAFDANTHITTRVMGTFGYVAPEYASSGKLTEKSDVYSFGVVILELITGRKPVDTSQPVGDESLVEWARPLLSHAIDNEEFESLVDPRLEKNYVESEMFCMIEVAAACVRHSSSKRPRMGQVVRAFDSVAASDLTNGMRPGESEAFDAAQQSAEIRLFRRMAFGFGSQDFGSDFFSQASSNT